MSDMLIVAVGLVCVGQVLIAIGLICHALALRNIQMSLKYQTDMLEAMARPGKKPVNVYACSSLGSGGIRKAGPGDTWHEVRW